ncbi:hypothetical protein GE107_10245 [Cohnella sp. CFH 77786]|uniref:DUF6376 family protein n=1 Tax=Cohnella sp. CFH 77786 TaxID=2662265 RepID=UPI001C60FE1B|nr:DUF6376 family protein [Cohnella sp. CFH 77786]MBW5446440.1 hypothetical protein [Cohnella sp. CFH 77786]
MKMKLALILVVTAIMTGCSAVEQIDRSVNYAGEAATYVEEAGEFARRLPDMAQEAMTDPELKEKLVSELEAMKTRAADFNALEAPEIAAKVHTKLQEYNAALQKEIDQVLSGLLEDIPAVQAVRESGMVQTLTGLTEMMEQISRLGGS